ncbi:TetR/AcrR family transcriptional regulator [Nocardia bovistercoris]|uniref:TetR/AcrR family transcriptional regulator n=1 Tax=Nocardia bovistercoris TaxID=2785916 RepID=A0A931N5M2_9NOCA|nr:TetR/AcrR family transcriptional regulator [Nocardia bovistercoris]MBH0780004.1 TetR/AcrR family transcriptional regulator [Nocardia bovistercoris]
MTDTAAGEPLRDRLVDVGVGLLEEVGAAQLGLRAITRAAGVSHGAPRRYFPTHNALLAAIAARGFTDLLARFPHAESGTPRDRLHAMATEYVGFAAARPEMFTLMFRHDLLEGSGENLRATTLPAYARFTTLVAEALGHDDPARALALWTNLHGIAALGANRSLALIAAEADARELADRVIELHLPR